MYKTIITLILCLVTFILSINFYLSSLTPNCNEQIFYYESEINNPPTLREIAVLAEECLQDERAIYTYPAINRRCSNVFMDYFK